MRWSVVVVASLMVAGCGSTTEPAGPSVGGTVPAEAPAATVGDEATGVATVQEAAAATITQLGGDDVATAATFLALDAGYDLEQIVDAGPAGRLVVDGTIGDGDGAVAPPAREPTGLIVDDVTADDPVSGFRQTPQRPLSSVMVRFQEAAEPPGKEVIYQRLFVLMGLIQRGYTLEQIMTALFTFGGLNDDFQLTDNESRVVEPADEAYDSLELTDEDYEHALADTTPTTMEAATTSAPKSEEEQQFDELVARAAGVYPITEDLGVHLQGLGDVISVVPPTGEFVVAPDGTISGSFVYTIVQGVDDARLTSKWDRTLVEAELTLLDDGLTFAAPMDLVITWNEGDQQRYVENVTGILEVDIGQLVVVGFTELDSVRFAR